jgi:hypothetical protein
MILLKFKVAERITTLCPQQESYEQEKREQKDRLGPQTSRGTA